MNAPATASSLVDLRSIRRDGGTQIRAALSEDHVCELVEAINAGVSLPPVVAFGDRADTTGALWLADGFHRAEAWSRAGVDRVPVERRNGTRRDAVLYACGANTAHGLKRTNLDKRRAVEAMLRDEEWSRWSDREIARRAGVTHPFVAEMRATGNGFQSDTRIGGDGRTINTANIGRAPQRPPAAPFAPPADDPPFADDPADDLNAVSLVTPPAVTRERAATVSQTRRFGPHAPRMSSHRSNVYRLTAETLLDARTVGKVLAGEHVRESTRAAVTAAARKLGIEVPPLQSSPRSGKGSNERYRARHAAKGKTHGDHARGSSSRGSVRGSNSDRSDRSDRSARGSQAPAQSAQTAAPSTGRVSA